ncbi:flagellar biosynthetic protein FliO [Gluconobacter morbifer]|uniref:Flagellar biosynthesis protein FliO n=1 Tax=Gluconobacter morbifer G707 TaxID=1088869 RepID=G6XFI4_9PROT|nr:flagellar biosynthetic protein FliO [Gluconobacter morbifer]EHH68942.1 hypothetical protein GMO_02490 [Gluconobacter morbifer G707]
MTLHDSLTAIAALFFIVVLVVCLRPLLNRLERIRAGRLNGEEPLALVGQMALDRSRRLSVVRYGAREVLVLTGGTQDVLMDWTPRESFASSLEDAS